MDILECVYIVIDAFVIIYGTEVLISIKTNSKLKILFLLLNILAGLFMYLPIQYATEWSTISGIALYLAYLLIISIKKHENIIIGIIWFISIGLMSVGGNYLFIIRLGIDGYIGKNIVIVVIKLTIIMLLVIINFIKNKQGLLSKFASIKDNSDSRFMLRKELALLLLFYVVVVTLLFAAYFIMNKMNLYQELKFVVNTIIIAIITLMILSLVFIKIMTKLYSTILNENEMNNYLKKEMEILSKSKNDYDKLQLVRHDLKHYLAVIKEMMNYSTKKEIYAYIDDVVKIIDSDAKYRVKLDDKLLESVINTKLDEMRNENIKVHSFVLNYSSYRNVNNVAIILMNLLDNAKEATLRCSDAGEVSIKSMIIGEYIKFEITNTCPVKSKFDIDNVQTSKKNKANHGLGIKSVLSIIEEENGIVDFKQSKGLFKVNLLIPK